MASPSLLCRVQALYPFESDDPSSLKFEEGDYIDVVSKLPSGWWDGWCNGNRGWFPSNYVKVIEELGSTGLVAGKKPTGTSIKNSVVDLFDDRVGGVESRRSSLPAHWSLQTKEDGTANYYINTLTGEMRSSMPMDDATSFYDAESDEDSITSTIDSSVLEPTYSEEGNAKWTERNTGLPLFNMSTVDTAWHADSQESKLQPSNRTGDITWNQVSMGVTLSINNLISAVKSDQRDSYKPLCAKIVQSVRSMLVASDTISKDSLHIKTSGTLRCHHRAMMASLSKIILSSQLCADNTTDDVSKLLSDLHELLLAIRNFISTCENIPIQVHPVDPVLLTPETGASIHRRQSLDGGIRAKYQLQSDLIENLEAYGSSMQEQMEAFRMNLSRHSDSRCSLAVLLFTQYRNFGNQNGQFLSILEDIDFEGIQSPALTVAKQRLYDGLGLLFCKMQMMTDESVAMDTVTEDMQSAAKDIMEAIGSICKIMSSLVAAKTKQSLKSSSNSSIMKNHGKESTQISSFSDFLQKSATPDLSYKRSQSLSVESLNMTPINTHKQNRSSAPVTQNQPAVLSEEGKSPSTAKLKQFFGDDPLSTEGRVTKDEETVEEGGVPRKEPQQQQEGGPQQQQQQGEEESYLQYDYSPNEIVFTLDGSVKGGTLPALVERMTLHDYLDMNFNNTFLLTYRSFCTSMELLELLEARYNIKPPHGLSSQQLEIWTTKKQKLIRLRVFNVLKIWLEQYYYEEDSVILDRLLFFTNTSIKDTLSFSAYQLERLIQKRKEACKDLKKLIITQQVETPDPILPRNLKKFRLLDIDYIEMARQLTMMDFKMYSAIKPVECLNKAWSRDSNTAANIQASIDYCNQVTTWVSDEILTPSEVKKRSTLIKYWVNVAERCRLLNNFNTCMAILSAFDNSAVGRLKRTWEMVGARTNHLVSQIRKLMGANRNFNQYRVLIHSVNPPCIPFLGIYLQDLTFIEDGNPNFLKTSKDLINFAKRAKTAEVIREMQQYQTMGYQFRIVEEIQTFIMANLHSSRDEDQLYRESLKLEPKERDDEKITRLLQESGFL